jgi:hypothetical protein
MSFAEFPAAKVQKAARMRLERLEELARIHPTPRGPDWNRLRDLGALAAAVQASGPEGVKMTVSVEDFALLALNWIALSRSAVDKDASQHEPDCQ